MRFLLTLIAGLLAPSLFAANLSFLAPTNNVLPTNLGKFRASNIVAAVNLGVGIDSPQEAVHVASNILVNGTKAVLSHTNNDGSVPQFRIESNSGGNYKTSVWSTAAISSTAPGQSFQVGTPAGAWTFDGSTSALTPPDITTDFGSISSPISNIVASAGSVLVLNGGRVGIGTNAPAASLHVNGDILATNLVAISTNNDNAQPGYLGEYISSLVPVGSAITLATTVVSNITSISLTAGDWDVSGHVNFVCTTATVTQEAASFTSTSVTLSADGSEAYSSSQLVTTTATDTVTPSRKRFSLAATTTVYLAARATFSAGSVGGYGQITARRVR